MRVVERGDKVVHILYTLSRETRKTRESKNSCVGTPSIEREKRREREGVNVKYVCMLPGPSIEQEVEESREIVVCELPLS